jgi:hypothetical protein
MFRVLRSPDAVDGGATILGGESLPIGGEDGLQPDLRVLHAATYDRPVDDATVRAMMADCCHFLRQLVRITSGVIESIGVGHVRQIVAAELPIPRGVIREDGTFSSKEAPGRDHRKEPRGRRHPVITLLQMALQGIRLLLQVTAGTHPNAHNEETLEQKKTREELREQERTFKNLLNGRM